MESYFSITSIISLPTCHWENYISFYANLSNFWYIQICDKPARWVVSKERHLEWRKWNYNWSCEYIIRPIGCWLTFPFFVPLFENSFGTVWRTPLTQFPLLRSSEYKTNRIWPNLLIFLLIEQKRMSRLSLLKRKSSFRFVEENSNSKYLI